MNNRHESPAQRKTPENSAAYPPPHRSRRAAPLVARDEQEVQMKSIITTAALTGVLAISMVTDALAWERKGSVTGPRGTNTFNAQGSCSGGSCSRSATATGAYGRTATRNGSGSCSDGSCSGSRSTTGPAGRTFQRSGGFSR
jgi:hypothetical protein